MFPERESCVFDLIVKYPVADEPDLVDEAWVKDQLLSDIAVECETFVHVAFFPSNENFAVIENEAKVFPLVSRIFFDRVTVRDLLALVYGFFSGMMVVVVMIV